MILSADLQELQRTIEGYAREFGLDFPRVHFEMIDYQTMNQVAAYDGFPSRYPHWRFGMEYERLSKSYDYGLHRIYELVINTDPCCAYLMASNNLVDQKLVMAHVYGHADFFKNNLWYAQTNRKMLDEMANHAARVRRHIERYGQEPVEDFIDACLSLDNLIDIHSLAIRRRPQREVETEVEEAPTVHKLRAKEYMDTFINPPDYLADQQRQLEQEADARKRFPEQPERDVLLFLLEHAPLENWQRDILDIVREEAYYFAPQGQTKVMNEGWASFVHTRIMTQRALTPDELIDYADHHSGTVATDGGRLNPYKLGLELYRDIQDRWNRGAFGPEYDNCDDRDARQKWDRQLGQGRDKVFQVRRIYNDIGFIEEFMTEDFCREHHLFNFDYNEHTEEYEISSRDFQEIKQRLLFRLTNFGQPIVEIVDGNYENRGELYLMHRHEGVNLDVPFAQETLKNLYALWSRPVHLETVTDEGTRVLYSFSDEGASEMGLD